MVINKTFGIFITSVIVSVFIISCANGTDSNNSEHEKEINNLVIFAKSYGLVKYFHPSDNAANIDWGLFSVYGTKQVRENTGKYAINSVLKNMYSAIAPTVLFGNKKQPIENISTTDSCGKWAYWQHQGLGMDANDLSEIYYSVRVNAVTKKSEASHLGKILKNFDAKDYLGREIVFRGRVRLKDYSRGTGHLILKITDKDGGTSFYNAMSRKPIKNNEWAEYTIRAKVDSSANKIAFGFSLKDKGTLFIDSYSISQGKPNTNSEKPILSKGSPMDLTTDWEREGSGYAFLPEKKQTGKENTAIALKFTDSVTEKVEGKLFEETPKPNEVLTKKIGDATYCRLPVTLCLEHGKTLPLVPNSGIAQFKEKLNKTKIDTSGLDFRIANVIKVYNIVEHFHPYLKELNIDWEKELRKAISKSYKDQTFAEHVETLEKMISRLQDGHARIEGYDKEKGRLPVAWDILEGKLVITNVLDKKLPVNVGDVVVRINGEDPDVFLDKFRSKISAGTKGWLNVRLRKESVIGKPGEEITVKVNDKAVPLSYTDTIHNDGKRKNWYRPAYRNISNDTKYINLTMNDIKTFNNLIPKFIKAKNLIFDLRGYPYPDLTWDVISYLIKEKDTASSWMRLPKYIYPDQDNVAGYIKAGRRLEPKKPYLGQKNIVFLTNGKAISYSESLLGYVKSYKLGTIIGQPTAGANGNFNVSSLLGGLKFVWTGLYLVQPNGEKVFARGILPDIEREETIHGLKENKDEFLDFAIQYLQKKNN
ncbi:S41 family peptidase [Sinomicrobium weinanense]|uniref:Tail specific protease domain-containing protein n=1 Tax=Sinomicrobium weinanense TaxID=2842200 RepID=A0A926Q366_9FLAO|nr:S41 family peptidase [Sinomicrobium weinanense]MBC9795430.1 hypothetical protein [Sinomicrobium weinanense]MBU3123955.1 hypothetical protein [Sinomicrobium weinanense]